MAADALKSTSITNLDAQPVIQNTSGQGAPDQLHAIDDSLTPTATGIATAASTYKMVRVPTTVKLKRLTLFADGQLDSNGAPTLTVKVGAFFSDSTVDGTAPANQGNVVNSGADFLAAVAFGRSVGYQTIDALSALTQAKRAQPLWQALGLTKDPGGYFDIVVSTVGPAATGVSNPIGCLAEYAW